jgi:hypothetical protein
MDNNLLAILKSVENETVSQAGVLGMKWGIRKPRNERQTEGRKKRLPKSSSPSSSQNGGKINKKDAARLRKESIAREKNWNNIYERRAKISDADLRKAVTRLQLENQMAREVNSAKALNATPAKKSLYKQMQGVALTTSRVTPFIVNALPKETQKNPKVQQVNNIAKGINSLTSQKDKKKD